MNAPLVAVATTLLATTLPAASALPAAPLGARYAVVLGERDFSSDAAPQLSESDAGRLLAGMESEEERSELAARMGLAGILDLVVGSVGLDGIVDEYSAAVGSERGTLLVRAQTSLAANQGDPAAAITRMVIERDGEVLSAPTVTALLGELAVVSSGSDDSKSVLWVVLQVE